MRLNERYRSATKPHYRRSMRCNTVVVRQKRRVTGDVVRTKKFSLCADFSYWLANILCLSEAIHLIMQSSKVQSV